MHDIYVASNKISGLLSICQPRVLCPLQPRTSWQGLYPRGGGVHEVQHKMGANITIPYTNAAHHLAINVRGYN